MKSQHVERLAKDLRKEDPRSPDEQLGGFRLAARCLDKCRATIAGKNGDFTFNCPMDQQFFATAGIEAGEFKSFVATGASDEEVDRWIRDHAREAAPSR